MTSNSEPVRLNAADRVLAISEKARQKSAQRSSTEVWGDVFGVVEENATEKQRLVANFLSAVGSELNAIDTALKDASVPEQLHKRSLSQIRNAFSVGALNSKWDDHAGKHLTPDVVMSLKWIAYTLPNEGTTASLEDMASILGLLDELGEQLASEGIPPGLKSLMEKHADEMRRAVQLFPVQGTASLSKAVRAVMADIQIDQDEIRTATQKGDPAQVKSVLSRFGAVFHRTAEVSGDLDKLRKGTGLVLEVVEAGRLLLT